MNGNSYGLWTAIFLLMWRDLGKLETVNWICFRENGDQISKILDFTWFLRRVDWNSKHFLLLFPWELHDDQNDRLLFFLSRGILSKSWHLDLVLFAIVIEKCVVQCTYTHQFYQLKLYICFLLRMPKCELKATINWIKIYDSNRHCPTDRP